MTISPIQIAMFGGLQICQEDKVVSHFPTRKTGALLAYLAYYPHQNHPREKLVDLFWPDLEVTAARHNLRQTLYSLRGLLEPHDIPHGNILIADKTYISLHPDIVTTDVQRFKSALLLAECSTQERRGALIEAIALYRGELLPEIYEEWALTEREHMAAAYLTALERLATEWEQSGQREQAVDCLRRLILADPFHVTAQERLIRLHATLGHPERARQQFRKLATLLASEWNEKPARELCAFVETLPVSSSLASNWTDPVLTASPEPLSIAFNIPSPHLPAPLTRFFGRVEELQEIQTLLTAPQRCVLTLLGAGGVGKTRIAIEIGHRLAPTFQNRVYFVSLAGLSEPQNISTALISCLELTLSLTIEPLEQVATALERAPSLLILDNMEHLLDADTEIVVQIVSYLTQRVPTLRCMVTSRHCLHCEGEREYLLHPLPTPASSEVLDKLFEVPSVALFLDRAQAIRPRFTLTASNAFAVAALCQRLEGVPLALELAAAQIGVFAPTQMLTQLDNRFAFLVHRGRSIAARHRSLHAALQWSFGLLSLEMQCLFLRLSVFRGGWTMTAAQAVCEVATIADSLHHLRETSLIVAEEHGEVIRFRMLEMLREFAQEQMTPEQQSISAGAHANYFLCYAEQIEPNLHGAEQQSWLVRLERDNNNFFAAMDYFQQTEAQEQALRLASALHRFWEIGSYYQEAWRILQKVLAPGISASLPVQAKTLTSVTKMARLSGHPAEKVLVLAEAALASCRAYGDKNLLSSALHEASVCQAAVTGADQRSESLAEESLLLARESGNLMIMAEIIANRAYVEMIHGDSNKGMQMWEEVLVINRRRDNADLIATAMNEIGYYSILQGNYKRAQTLIEEALAMKRQLGNHNGIAHYLWNLGILRRLQGHYEESRQLFKDSLTIRRKLGEKGGIADCLSGLASLALDLNDWQNARALYEEALAIRQELGYSRAVAWSLRCLGCVSLQEGDHPEAERLFRRSIDIYGENRSDRRGAGSVLFSLGCVYWQRNKGKEAQSYWRQSLQIRWNMNDKRGLAELLEAFAQSSITEGSMDRGAEYLGAAASIRAHCGMPLPPAEQPAVETSMITLHHWLGESTFERYYTQGQSTPLDQIVMSLLLE